MRRNMKPTDWIICFFFCFLGAPFGGLGIIFMFMVGICLCVLINRHHAHAAQLNRIERNQDEIRANRAGQANSDNSDKTVF